MTPADSNPTGCSRATAWEWTQAALLVLNLTWTTLCLGGLRAQTMIASCLLTGVLLSVNLLEFASAEFRRPDTSNSNTRVGFHRAGWFFFPFLIYAAANVIWVTPVRWLGWRDWLGWAQMIAIFWATLNGIRSDRTRWFVFGSILVLALSGMVLALYQRFSDPTWLMLGRVQAPQFLQRASGFFGIPNSLAAVFILLIPVLILATVRRAATPVQRVLFGYIAACLAVGLVLTVSRGAWIALAIVLAAWPLIGMRRSRRRRLTWSLGVASALAIAGVLVVAKVPQAHERIHQLMVDGGERSRPIMWRAAWEIFRGNPLWGGGAGSFNTRFDQHRQPDFQDDPVWAHNDYLNTLSDYGAVGFTLFFGAVLALAWSTWRRTRLASAENVRTARNRWLASGLFVGLVAFALQLAVEFHFKIPALAMLVATIGALVVRTCWPQNEVVPASRWTRGFAAMAAVMVVLTSLGVVQPIYRAEAIRQAAREVIHRFAVTGIENPAWGSALKAAREQLGRAVQFDPANAAAWADLSYATSLMARIEPERTEALGSEAQRAAERALKISDAVAEFWIRRGVARDLQGERIAAGADYVKALQLAPAKSLVWYYHAVHLSLSPNATDLALASARMSLRLDPGNRQAQALARRLADRSRASKSSSHASD